MSIENPQNNPPEVTRVEKRRRSGVTPIPPIEKGMDALKKPEGTEKILSSKPSETSLELEKKDFLKRLAEGDEEEEIEKTRKQISSERDIKDEELTEPSAMYEKSPKAKKEEREKKMQDKLSRFAGSTAEIIIGAPIQDELENLERELHTRKKEAEKDIRSLEKKQKKMEKTVQGGGDGWKKIKRILKILEAAKLKDNTKKNQIFHQALEILAREHNEQTVEAFDETELAKKLNKDTKKLERSISKVTRDYENNVRKLIDELKIDNEELKKYEELQQYIKK